MSKPDHEMTAVLARIFAKACGRLKNTLLTRLKARERNRVRHRMYSETTEQITRLPDWEKTQKTLPPVTYEEESQELRRDGLIRGQTIRYRMSTSTKNPIGISSRLTRPEMADKSVHFYDSKLSEALDHIGEIFNLDGMERPRTIILSDDEFVDFVLASYSAQSNTLFLRERVFGEQSYRAVLKTVKANSGISGPLFALEGQPLATIIHELAHWLHAERARNLSNFGPEDSLGAIMRYTAQEAVDEVKRKYPDFDFRKISKYAGRSWVNEPEEVIAEAVTRYLLGDANDEVRIIMKEAGYERFLPRSR